MAKSKLKKIKTFKPGEEVVFCGIVEGFKKIQGVSGKLILADNNTSIKGVMRIEGDVQGMLFCPNGMVYCHPRFGVVLRYDKP